jgi:hypothetical protein
MVTPQDGTCFAQGFGRGMDGRRWKNGKRELGLRDGKIGRDLEPFPPFPVHFRFFSFRPVDVLPTKKYCQSAFVAS